LMLSQGGAVVVALVVFFFYRRDWQRIESKDEEKIHVLTELVSSVAAAIEASTAQSVATEKAISRLQRSMEDGGRRAYDPTRRGTSEDYDADARRVSRNRARDRATDATAPTESVRSNSARDHVRAEGQATYNRVDPTRE
jgi:hypothetical protein